MKKLVSILMILVYVFLPSLSESSIYHKEIMNKAKGYLYVRERTNNNDAPEIDAWLRYLGLPSKLSYCLTFCIFCIGKSYEEQGKRCPVPKIGRVSTFLKTVQKDKYAFKVYTARDIEYGISKLKPAMIACWSHKKVLTKAGSDSYDWAGHAELVEDPKTSLKFDTIGANTTGVDDLKSQREQSGGIKKGGPVGGVWLKHRTVSKQKDFYTEAFVEVL